MNTKTRDNIAYILITVSFIIWTIYVLTTLLPPDFLVYNRIYGQYTDPEVYIRTVLGDTSGIFNGVFKSRVLSLVFVRILLPFMSVEIAFAYVNISAAWLSFVVLYKWGRERYHVKDYVMLLILLVSFMTYSMLRFIWQPWTDGTTLLCLVLISWLLDTGRLRVAVVVTVIGILNQWIIIFAWSGLMIQSVLQKQYKTLSMLIPSLLVTGLTFLIPLNTLVFGVRYSTSNFIDTYASVFQNRVLTVSGNLYQISGVVFNLYMLGLLALAGIIALTRRKEFTLKPKVDMFVVIGLTVFFYCFGTLTRQAIFLLPFLFEFICKGSEYLFSNT